MKCYIHASYGVALFVGDAVDLQTETDYQDPTGKHMSIMKATAGATNFIFGVIVGFEVSPTALQRKYSPASTEAYAHVVCDPKTIFEIRDDGGTAPTLLFPGQNADLIFTHSGSTDSGLSGMELDTGTTTAPAADATYQLYILNLRKTPDETNVNENGYAGRSIWEVLINLHRLDSCGDGSARLGVTGA